MWAGRLCLLLGLCFASGVGQAQEHKAAKSEEGIDSAELYDKMLKPESVVTNRPNDWCSPHLVQPPSSQMAPMPQDSNAPVDPTTIRPPSISSQLAQQPSMAFNTNSLASSGLGASRNVPAFIGDFFGGGGTSTTSRVAITGFGFANNIDFNGGDGTVNLDVIYSGAIPTPMTAADITMFATDPMQANAFQPLVLIPPLSFTQNTTSAPAGTPLVEDLGDPGVTVNLNTYFNSLTGQNGDTTFNNGLLALDGNTGGVAYQYTYAYDTTSITNAAGGAIAAAPSSRVGRQKLTENTSPIPQDRAYVNYSYFNNTPLGPGGIDVNRVTPGVEKTFFDGNFSCEIRAPFATTLSSDIVDGGITNGNNSEFGNVTAYFKALVFESQSFAISSGLGVAIPTADNVNIRNGAGQSLIQVKNESIHILPFVGGVYTPNDRLFLQGMMQFDVDANGNDVRATDFMGLVPTGDLSSLGTFRDRTYMFLDFNLGYWVYLDRSGSGFITGVAPMFELHYNQSIDHGDLVAGNVNGTVYDFGRPGNLSLLNSVFGITARVRDNANITLAYATPIGGDQQFDGEVRLSFNWLFGNRRSRGRF